MLNTGEYQIQTKSLYLIGQDDRAVGKMLNYGLEKYFTQPRNSSNYFDFVERKMESENPVRSDSSTHSAETGKDAFDVQVMDQKTTDELKRRYFNGYTFPK